ncbi:unnamed protein product, partial [Closterium sp. NIES-53]
MDSGASHCFFRDHTTLTPLPKPVFVALADPTLGPVTVCYTTTLPCPAFPSGSLTDFHVPSFSRNLVGVRPLVSQHVGVWIEPSVETPVCVDGDTAATAAVAAAVAMAAAATVAAAVAATAPDPCHYPPSVVVSCSCWSLAHPTVLWHHRMGHPSISRLRAMSSQHLVLGLPRSFFLVVVDDYSRYTTVFPLVKKSDVTSTLIQWLLTTTDTRVRRVSCLHSDRGAEPQATCLSARGFTDQSLDRISPRAVPCVFLRFLEDLSDYTFYHPPLHQFFDSRDVRFDESVLYYISTASPPGPAPLDVSHDTPPPSVAPQVQPPYPQSSSQPTADPAGAGFCGEDPGFASSRGAGVGAESCYTEPVTARDSSLRGAGVTGAIPGGATPGGAPSAGPGEPGTDPVISGGAGSGGGATGSLESGLGATTALDTTPPSHSNPTRHQARVRHAREEQLELEREERELERQQLELQRLEEEEQQQQPEQEQPQQQPQQQQQQPPPPPVSGLRTLGLPSPSSPSPPSPPVSGPPLPSPDPSPAVFPPPLPLLSPPISHTWPSRRSPRARPSSPVLFTDLRTALFRSSLPCSYPSVLPSPESALTASLSTPDTDYYSTYCPVLSRVLASLVTNPRVSLSSVSALTACVTEFASTRCLDYATSLVAAPPTTTSPDLYAMLLAPEGDSDALDIPNPRTYAEAVSGPWASQWRAAMDTEMASYRSTGTYVNEVPPPGANVVDGMWIFTVKQPTGSPLVFKARYVARAQRDYELHSLDFSTAFLQGSLHEEVWLRRPSTFTGTFSPETKWRLLRPVYGLRQAPREWHDTLCSTLSDLSFQPSSANPSLFVRHGSTPFFVLVYVEDLVFATADVKLELQKRHTCTDLGELCHYLGLQITRDRAARTITLSQSHMVQQVLQRLTGPFPDEPFEPSGPYAKLVGCLMYLMTCTRPDLAFPLNILARFVAPGRHRPVHWTAAVRVAKYLATTSGMGLVLGGRQSTQGYCFSLGSGAISWRSTRSSSVSTSTAEAEIYTRAMAAQELRWLTFLLTDLSERSSSVPTLFTDNKRRGQACFDFVESEANTADIFTKALPP